MTTREKIKDLINRFRFLQMPIIDFDVEPPQKEPPSMTLDEALEDTVNRLEALIASERAEAVKEVVREILDQLDQDVTWHGLGQLERQWKEKYLTAEGKLRHGGGEHE